MATTAPIVIPVKTPGLSQLQKMEQKMRALEAQVEKLTKDLDKNTQATKRNGKAAATASGNIQRFGVAFRSTLGPVVALYGAIRVLNGSLATLGRREADVKTLQNGLNKLGAEQATLAKLKKQADAFGDSTLFNEEDFIAGAGLLTSFTSVAIDDYQRVIDVASDLAQTNKGAVKDSLLQVAKALNAPSQNLTALSRSGIQFTEQQKEQIKTLEQSGRLLEAQQMILKELERQYGGNAKAAATGFAGAVDTLGENFRDFQETLGQGVLPIAEQFVTTASAILDTLAKLDPQIVTVTSQIALMTAGVIALNAAFKALKATAIAAYLARLVPIIKAGKGALAAKAIAVAGLNKVLAITKALMLSIPWVAAAAAIGFVAVKTYEAVAAQKDFESALRSTDLQLKTLKLRELEEKLRKAEEAAKKAAAGIGQFGGVSGTASLQIAILKSQIDELKKSMDAVSSNYTVGGITYDWKTGQAIDPPTPDPKIELPGLTGGGSKGGGKTLSDGSKERRNLEQQIKLLQTKSEIEKSLLAIEQQKENAILRIQQTVQAGQQADLISLERRKAQLLQLEAIRQYGEDAVSSAQALIDSTNLQIEADARRRELIAEGINPALADQLVSIEQNFDKEREFLGAKLKELEASLALVDAESEKGKAIQENIDKLKKYLDLLGKAQEDAEGNAKDNNPDDPGKIEQYMKQLESDLMDTEGMIVSLAQTVESELGSAMSNAISGIIDGTQTAEEAFANMFKAIGKAFIDMATQMIAKALVMKVLGIAFGGGGGGGGGFGVMPKTAGLDFSSAFAEGGFVDGPTNAMIGEGGDSEYVIPSDKMSSALQRYNSGARGDAVTEGANSVGGDDSSAWMDAPINITTGPVMAFEGKNYVTQDEFAIGVQSAAKQGEARALRKLQMSPAARRRAGVS